MLYVASGSQYPPNSLTSTNIWKSQDGGVTWTELGLGGIDGAVILSIVIDPHIGDLVYATGRDSTKYPAFYRSEDGGSNWTSFNPGLNSPEFEWGAIKHLCINPDNRNILYAAAGSYTRFVKGPNALLVSTDRGETWQTVSTDGLPDARVLDMACSRDYLYLGTNDGVFRARVNDYVQAFSASATEEQRLYTTAGDELIIPPGALSEDTEITLSIVNSEDLPEPPPGTAKIARAFDFGPDGTVFQQPVTVVFKYEDSDVPPGMSEDDLLVFYYESSSSTWVPLSGVVDPEANTITCQVDHFTAFALMLPDSQPPEVSITNPTPGSNLTGVVPFSADASDNVTLWKVEFYVDGMLLEVDTAAPYVHSLDTGFISPGPHTLTAIAHDTAGLTASDAVSVLVRSTRRGTSLDLEEPAPAQYSDPVTARAVLRDDCGNPVADREVAFSLGAEQGSAVTGEDGVAQWTARMDLPCGTHPDTLSADFAGDYQYLESHDRSDIQVMKESASLSYEGSYLARVDTPVNLKAELREEDDGSPGDVASAGAVAFDIHDAQGTLVRQETAAVMESEPGRGIAEVASPPLPAGIYTVRTRLPENPYYDPPPEVSTELAVYDPQGGFITGGGLLCGGGLKTFAFVVRPSSVEPWLPRGHLVFVDHADLCHPRRISATGFAWLVIPSEEDIAYVAGTCTLDGQPDHTFNLTVEDKGCWIFPRDTLHLVVKNAEGAVVYEARGTISGGNIKIQRN